MAKKGLDTAFLHYGIRKEYISLIIALCTEHQLDFDWVKEDLLKESKGIIKSTKSKQAFPMLFYPGLVF